MSAGYTGSTSLWRIRQSLGCDRGLCSGVAIHRNGAWRLGRGIGVTGIRRSPLQSSVRAIRIEICPEIEQLVLQVRRRPEQRAIQILAVESCRSTVPQRDGTGEHRGRF